MRAGAFLTPTMTQTKKKGKMGKLKKKKKERKEKKKRKFQEICGERGKEKKKGGGGLNEIRHIYTEE